MSKTQSQEYRGNGAHQWEVVDTDINEEQRRGDQTMRLRVPGGWLYRNAVSVGLSDGGVIMNHNTVFVPMPAVVKHEV